jgi:hypothetical protein
MMRTEFVHPPIPIRSMDWAAYDDDDCMCPECHPTIGRGATEAEAIADLQEQLNEL